MSTAKDGEGKIQNLLEIKKTVIIDASPEIVFKAIINPYELTDWFPNQAILEAKVGGKVKFITLKNSPKNPGEHLDMDYIMEGTHPSLVPNKEIILYMDIS